MKENYIYIFTVDGKAIPQMKRETFEDIKKYGQNEEKGESVYFENSFSRGSLSAKKSESKNLM